MRTQHPGVPPARAGARRRDRHDPRHGRRHPLRARPSSSMKALLDEGYDAVFVGTGAPTRQGARHPRPQRSDREHPHRHRLARIGRLRPHRQDRRARAHHRRRQHRDGLLPHVARLGGKDIKVMARRPRQYFKASPWELEDAEEEQVEIVVNHAPKRVRPRERQAHGHGVRAARVERGRARQADVERRRHRHPSRRRRRSSRSARRTPSRGSSATSASSSTSGTCRSSTRRPSSATRPGVFFGGDAAWGPKNIIWAVAHGARGGDLDPQPLPGHPAHRAPAAGDEPHQPEDGASPSGATATTTTRPSAQKMKHVDLRRALQEAATSRSSWASTPSRRRARCERCLNCDIQTVFTAKLCIECDACVDVCPVQLPDDHPRRRRGRPARAPDRARART